MWREHVINRADKLLDWVTVSRWYKPVDPKLVGRQEHPTSYVPDVFI